MTAGHCSPQRSVNLSPGYLSGRVVVMDEGGRDGVAEGVASFGSHVLFHQQAQVNYLWRQRDTEDNQTTQETRMNVQIT